MKQLKKALQAKQAAKAAQDKSNSKAVRKEQKLDAKLKKAAQQWGHHIVQVAIEAHTTTMELLQECKGKSALELAEIKQSVKQAWQEYADGLTARGTHSNRETVDQMRRQSVYNRNSEMQAVLSAYEKYAAMDGKARKEFDSREGDISGYHALVAFCRYFNKGNKRSNGESTPVAARERKAWQKNKSERIAKAKDMLRFATLDALIVISEYVEKRIAQEKRSLEQKASGKPAVVKQLKRAAGIKRAA